MLWHKMYYSSADYNVQFYGLTPGAWWVQRWPHPSTTPRTKVSFVPNSEGFTLAAIRWWRYCCERYDDETSDTTFSRVTFRWHVFFATSASFLNILRSMHYLDNHFHEGIDDFIRQGDRNLCRQFTVVFTCFSKTICKIHHLCEISICYWIWFESEILRIDSNTRVDWLSSIVIRNIIWSFSGFVTSICHPSYLGACISLQNPK